MEIGVLKPENENCLAQHKTLGFKSETDMINEALDILRKNLKQRQRRAELLKAGKDYAQDNSYAWADLDFEPFPN
jgi:hypothetical protein